MFLKKRAFLLAAAFGMVLSALATGCDPQLPSAAEREVREAKNFSPLTKAELNQLFEMKRANPTLVPYGQMYEVTGTVEKVYVKEKSQAPGSDDDMEYAIVTIYLPDYAAGTIDLHFNMTHRYELLELKQGDTIKVRGKLSDQFTLFRESKMDLNGCLIQK